MEILVAGNSQAVGLKWAYEANPHLLGSRVRLSFYVTPGGHGPYFDIRSGQLQVATDCPFPAFAVPQETPGRPIDSYDAVVVSALGYVDGGYHYSTNLYQHGLLFGFDPKPNDLVERLISRACFTRSLLAALDSLPGSRFLHDLRRSYRGPVLVQPFPLLSEAVKEHDGWPLRRMYKDYLGMHRFLCQQTGRYLEALCHETETTLLPYPNQNWVEAQFTPREYMDPNDGFHGYSAYGALVFEQVARHLGLTET